MFVKSLLSGVCLAAMLSAGSGDGVRDTRVSDAAQQGNLPLVQRLVAQKADVNGPEGDGMTALHWAAYLDHLEMARVLIAAGANVQAVTRLGGLTPLFLASKNGSAPMIALLLKAGAQVNSADDAGTTPLMFAAESGNAEAVRTLLDRGAEVNAKEKSWGQTALMFASAYDRTAVVKILLAHGADTKVTTGTAPVDRAKVEANRQRVVQGRDAKEAAERAKANDFYNRGITVMGGMTALLFAAREGNLDTIQALISGGADVNQVSAADGTSALTDAIFNGHYGVAKYLLDHGANPNLVNVNGLAPLYATIDMQYANRTWYPAADISQEKVNYLDLMKELLARGADPNQRINKKLWFRRFHDDWVDAVGANAFWRAAQANDVAAMKLLVAHGADTKVATTHGATPLIVAAGYGYAEQTTVVVPGARLEAVKYLVNDLGADVNAKDDKGYTPLHGAAYVGDNQVIEFLVSRGADITARSHGVLATEGQGVTEAPPGKGDTVADMANGPREQSLLFPQTVALAVRLGSRNSHNCRSSTCVPDGGK